jgi:hypothetical protein
MPTFDKLIKEIKNISTDMRFSELKKSFRKLWL